MSLHLLLPFFASLILGVSALFTKRARNDGVSIWTITLIGNLLTAAMFSGTLFLGGEVPDWSLLWQPAVIGFLYVLGQSLILLAISYGDVSVALPMASLKVVVLALLLTLTGSGSPTAAIWGAAALAAAGVFLINRIVPKQQRHRVLTTQIIALGGASTFALFDICLQSWSDNGSDYLGTTWSTGRLLPISFWFAALISLAYYPFSDRWSSIKRSSRQAVLWAATLVGLQALMMCLTLSLFGDAARVNVIYSLRGLWAVVLAWIFAQQIGGQERELPRSIMLTRLFGALLLIVAVIVAILNPATQA